MIIGIIGSREGVSEEFMLSKLKELKFNPLTDVFISGGARGVDTFAEKWAKEQAYGFKVIRPVNPDIPIYYLYRDVEIVTKAQKIIAFWNGKSKGTEFVINYAKGRGKEVIIYEVKEDE